MLAALMNDRVSSPVQFAEVVARFAKGAWRPQSVST